jgi:hypothetical protein
MGLNIADVIYACNVTYVKLLFNIIMTSKINVVKGRIETMW